MPVFLRWLLRLGPTNPIAVRLVQNGSRRTRHTIGAASPESTAPGQKVTKNKTK